MHLYNYYTQFHLKVLKKTSKKKKNVTKKEKKKIEKKSHQKMNALMKTWQTGVLAQKFESKEKICPKVKTWQTGTLGKYHGENLANRRHV